MGRKMKADRVQQGSETGDLPVPVGWELLDEGRVIQRVYPQPSFEAAVAMVTWIAALARECGCEPTIEVTGSKVVVTVAREDAALARLLDHP